jgi:hypothetical protein
MVGAESELRAGGFAGRDCLSLDKRLRFSCDSTDEVADAPRQCKGFCDGFRS